MEEVVQPSGVRVGPAARDNAWSSNQGRKRQIAEEGQLRAVHVRQANTQSESRLQGSKHADEEAQPSPAAKALEACCFGAQVKRGSERARRRETKYGQSQGQALVPAEGVEGRTRVRDKSI